MQLLKVLLRAGNTIFPPLIRRVFALLLLLLGAVFGYVIPAWRLYDIYWLQAFDYGIFYHSTRLLSLGASPIMRVRGLHAWADNQDYLQLLFAPLHWFPGAAYSLLLLSASFIVAPAFLAYGFLRKDLLVAVCVAVGILLSPFLINMNLDPIHTEACATALLVGAILCAYTNRERWFAVLCGLALLAKEDVAFSVIALALVVALDRNNFKISRRLCGAIVLASVALLGVNLLVVKPYFLEQTCAWLGQEATYSKSLQGVPVHWYAQLFAQGPLATIQKFASRPDILPYLAKLLWPLLLFIRTCPWLALLPLPAVAINILSSSEYLTQGVWHYDHSSLAMVIGGLLIGIQKARHPRVVALVFLAVSSTVLVFTPKVLRVDPIGLIRAADGLQSPDIRVTFLEELDRALPAQAILSADYTSLNYLLTAHRDVYMFTNPFRREYFGAYGLCEIATPAVLPDVVVLKDDFGRKHFSALAEQLREYEMFVVALPNKKEEFTLLVRADSPLRDATVRAAQSVVARMQGTLRETPLAFAAFMQGAALP
ncbi:MAG: DUF2079 domain-containing protein [Deltaproteobacteria bacterium]|nr:DUF2079 domain-containing protein [Deltaproteobacteria bacterium]